MNARSRPKKGTNKNQTGEIKRTTVIIYILLTGAETPEQTLP